jgi:AcrR family transcriptional regulator
MNDSLTQPDARARRRAARRDDNMSLILDAAEAVFGEDGIRDGAVRTIAARAGFSPAGIYVFFENKQHLLSATMTRRGDELIATIEVVAESDAAPLDKLHRIIDDTHSFFAERPNFRAMMRHMRGGETIVGPALAEFAPDVNTRFERAMLLLAGVVRDGQAAGEIRDGDPRSLAHLYSVLVNEFVLSPPNGATAALSSKHFHELVDGALRSPTPRARS